MKAFTYQRAETAEHAAAAAVRPGAKIIAGGTNLLDLMKLQVETPSRLVDINRLSLDEIEDTADGGLRIGTLVRNSDLAADRRVRQRYSVLSRALLAGASAQLRNKPRRESRDDQRGAAADDEDGGQSGRAAQRGV
jgi:xanthine dehydrogenase YagS FAD-binding subunit